MADRQPPISDAANALSAPVDERRAPQPVDPIQSTTIRVARVVCILFMTTSHAWPGSGRILAADVAAPLHWLYVTVVSLLGQASVPLLSIISGLLFVSSAYRKQFGTVIAGKFKVLIVPMIVWSIPMVGILFLEPYITGRAPLQWDLMDWGNGFLSITEAPANGPLHFFHDIFVMVLYGCAILTVFRFSRIAGFAIAVGIALLEQRAGGFLVFRNQIALMYVVGLLLALSNHASWRPNWPLVVAGMAAFGLSAASGLLNSGSEQLWLMRLSELVPRAAMALLMWRLCYEIACRPNRLHGLILRLEPHIFVVFCAHYIVVKPFAFAAAQLGWSETMPLYPLLLVAQVGSFVAAGLVLSHLLKPFPWLRGKSRGENAAVAGPDRPISQPHSRL